MKVSSKVQVGVRLAVYREFSITTLYYDQHEFKVGLWDTF